MKCFGRCSRFRVYLFLSLFCLALCSVGNAQTCASDTTADIDNGNEDLGPSLNAYAIIFRDADPRNTGCNQSAANHLEAKLIDTFGQDYPIKLDKVYPIVELNALDSATFRHHVAASASRPIFQGWGPFRAGRWVPYIHFPDCTSALYRGQG